MLVKLMLTAMLIFAFCIIVSSAGDSGVKKRPDDKIAKAASHWGAIIGGGAFIAIFIISAIMIWS